MIYKNILGLIHNTPVVQLKKIENSFLKLESFNPMGSIKDRTAFSLIQNAINKKQIHKETILIEATSGNTGVALAYISRILELNLILIMPEGLSKERETLLKSFGVKIIFTPQKLGMQGALNKLSVLLKENSNYLNLQQFDNPANPAIHSEFTAKEIAKDFTDESLDVFVSAVGTGGTITGIAKTLKNIYPNLEVVAVEPQSKIAIPNKNKTIYTVGPKEDTVNEIQGIGAGFVPKILNLDLINTICRVSNKEAINGVFELAQSDGVFAGLSTGAVFATIKYLKQLDKYKNKTILGIAPDTGERYLSILEEHVLGKN